MKLIGITTYSADGKMTVNKAYTDSFIRDGICPVTIPVFPIETKEYLAKNESNEQRAAALADKLDGLVITGGSDINPIAYNDTNYSSFGCNMARDMFEFSLAKAFQEKGKPIMGICRGFQLLGIYLNFPYFLQDVGSKENHNGQRRELASRSEPAHAVYIKGRFRDYLLAKDAVTAEEDKDYSALPVNSWHHQGFSLFQDPEKPEKGELKKTLGYYEGIQVDVIAQTRTLLEAFETKDGKIFGVQWHPEEYGSKGLTIQYFIDKFINKG